MVSLSGIFHSLNPWDRHEDEAPPPPPHRPATIKIDAGKSQAEIIADIQKAIADGADINQPLRNNRETPLHAAARLGLNDVVTALIDAGAVVNTTDGYETPFMCAVEGLHPDTMELLVKKGADPTQPDSIPQDAMVKFFLIHPWQEAKDPGFPDRDRACLKFLLDHGLKMKDWNKDTIYTERPHLMPLAPELYPVRELEDAAKNGDWAKVFKMIDDVISPDAPASYGGITPLIYAIESDNLDALNTLLDKGAGLETGTRYMTPIMHAATAGAEKCFNRLVRAGADITKEYGDDWDGWSTLQELAERCKTNPNMGAYAANAIAHKDDPVEINIDTGTDHKIKVHSPLRLKHAPAMG